MAARFTVHHDNGMTIFEANSRSGAKIMAAQMFGKQKRAMRCELSTPEELEKWRDAGYDFVRPRFNTTLGDTALLRL